MQRDSLQRAPVYDRVAFRVVCGAVCNGLASLYGQFRNVSSRALRGAEPTKIETDRRGSRAPFAFELRFVAMILGKPGALGDVLCSSGSAQPALLQFALDILAAVRKLHDLIAGVASELPFAAPAGELDAVTQLSETLGKMGPVQSRRP